MPIVAYGPGPFSGLTPQRGRSPVVSSSSGAAPNMLDDSSRDHEVIMIYSRSRQGAKNLFWISG
jgi:hypothetical protein